MNLTNDELRDCRTALVDRAFHFERIVRDKASDPWQIDAAKIRQNKARDLAKKIGDRLRDNAEYKEQIKNLNATRGDQSHLGDK